MNRYRMLMKIEHSYQKSIRLPLLMLLLYVVLTMVGVVLSFGFGLTMTYDNFVYLLSNTFLQFSHLGFAYVLLNAFCREHEEKSYFWLRKHLFAEKHIVTSKYVSNTIFLLLSMLLYMILALALSKYLVFRNADMDWLMLTKVLCVVLSSVLYTTTLQLLFGYYTTSFAKGAILWIVYWFLISTLNGLTPVIGGYLSPLDSSSLQAGMLSYLTKGDLSQFANNHTVVDLAPYFSASVILPLVYTVACCIIVYFQLVKRRRSYS